MRSIRSLALVLAPAVAVALAPDAKAQWSYLQEAAFNSFTQFGGNCGYGHSVALDGDTALVGVPHPGAGGMSGAAVVFRKVAGVWTQEATLSPSDPATGNYFGWSVALDGDVAVVGAIGAYYQTSPGVGAAYVFTRTGTTWTQVQKVQASDPLQSAEFGWSVSVSGSTFVVGAPQATYNNEGGRGAAYVFDLVGSTWTQVAKLAGANTTFGARNGSSVAIEGNRLVIGARTTYEDGGQTIGTGSAYVFARSGSTWSQEAKLQATPYVAWAQLGSSIALDGNRVVVGAPGENINTGAAYVFDKVGANWVQKGRLSGAGTDSGDWFGWSVDVSANRAVVGAYNYDSVTPVGNGCVKVYDFDGATWSEELELLGNPMFTGDTLGEAVAMQGDTVVGGSPSIAFGQIGRMWIWSFDPAAVEAYCVAKQNSLGCTPAITWSGVASATSASPFQVGANQVLAAKPGLMFYGYGPNSAPFQGGTLCVQAPIKRTSVQTSTGSGSNCLGTYTYDVNALIQSGADPVLVAGFDMYCQYWTRDQASPSTTGLTNALRARIQP
ncbi:MAG: FG-GAP repeat protein [Planctomycetes bacterium]|nr:FG-GAP repeat protein [Planctomycetota bacterium]